MGGIDSPLIIQLGIDLQIHTAAARFTQPDRGPGAGHVCHFIGSILLPDRHSRLGALERSELDTDLFARVDRRVV